MCIASILSKSLLAAVLTVQLADHSFTVTQNGLGQPLADIAHDKLVTLSKVCKIFLKFEVLLTYRLACVCRNIPLRAHSWPG